MQLRIETAGKRLFYTAPWDFNSVLPLQSINKLSDMADIGIGSDLIVFC